MSNAFTFIGGFVKAGDGATPTENFTAVSEVQTASFSGDKIDTVDVTHAQSPSATREFIATLADPGEFQFTANYLPQDATQINLKTLKDSRILHNWKVVLPSSLGTFSFAGLINALDRNLDFSKEAKLTCKIKISGPISFA